MSRVNDNERAKWQELVTTFPTSGLTRTEYCRKHGIATPIKIKLRLLDIDSMTLSEVADGEHVFDELPDPYQVGHPIKRNTSYIASSVNPGQLVVAFGDAVLHSFTTYVKVDRRTTVKSFTLAP